MNERDLEAGLRGLSPPPASAAARARALEAATAEFARVRAAANDAAHTRQRPLQGLLVRLRLRSGQTHERHPMSWSRKTTLLGAAASFCLAVVALLAVRQHDPALPGDARPVPVGQVAQDAPAGTTTLSTPAEAEHPRVLTTAAPELPEPVPATQPPPASVAGPAQQRSAEVPRAGGIPLTPPAPPPPAADDGAASSAVMTNARAAPQAGAEELKKDKIEAQASESVIVTAQKSQPQRAMSPKNSMNGFAGALGTQSLVYESPAEPARDEGRDAFEHFEQNSVVRTSENPVSTFSADVDTSSYSFVRRQLNAGTLPQQDAVRVEEMINYFDYAWPRPDSREAPFQPTIVVSDSPWGKGKKLVHIGIKGYEVPATRRPDANLVLLLDVSGSMDSPDKLPLVKQSMKLLLRALQPTDTVAIVVYAGAAGQVLAPTPVREKEKILDALDSLTPGGSTAGAEGIRLAYELAASSFRKEGVNRVILCTDGDFNVGISGTNPLKSYVERERAKGIYLSVLGFGQGNYRDELAQALAQNGNGVAAYIDTVNEAQKVLVQEAGASLFPIAKDVKFQVEFNPATVAEYRLVGYETRALKREDFNNDAVDAGDVGSGHTVTAIYEITPAGSGAVLVDESRYAQAAKPAGKPDEYGFLRIRYKLPESSKSKLIEAPIAVKQAGASGAVSRDVQFSTAVAGFAQLLRGGRFTGALTYEQVADQAQAAKGEDPFGYRGEFVQLVRRAARL